MKKEKCQIVFGFNALGMILFACKTHGNLKSKYERLPVECRTKFVKVVEKLFKAKGI